MIFENLPLTTSTYHQIIYFFLNGDFSTWNYLENSNIFESKLEVSLYI